MKNVIYIALAVLVIAGIWVFFFRPNAPTQEKNNPSESMSSVSSNSNENQALDQSMESGEIKTITIEASNFKFSVKEIRVKVGDKVRINLVGKEGFHDFVLDEFNARTERVQTGQTASVEFTADKPGTFEYYCSVGNHHQLGMAGKIIVE